MKNYLINKEKNFLEVKIKKKNLIKIKLNLNNNFIIISYIKNINIILF